MAEIVVYVLASIFVAWLARRTQIGFVGFLLLSLLITPVGTMVILLITNERTVRKPA